MSRRGHKPRKLPQEAPPANPPKDSGKAIKIEEPPKDHAEPNRQPNRPQDSDTEEELS